VEWMEIIELRSTGTNNELLEKQLRVLMQDVEKDNKEMGIKILFRFKLDTDFRIYLKHNASVSIDRGSLVGQSLVAILKEYGLVNYSKWIEMK